MKNPGINRFNSILSLIVLLLSLGGGSAWAEIKPARKPVHNNCVALGSWVIPGSGQTTQQDVITRAAQASVVLLGETHVNADH
ncbi:MAG: signal protein PDZ, partial [Pseudomonadota bacterium]